VCRQAWTTDDTETFVKAMVRHEVALEVAAGDALVPQAPVTYQQPKNVMPLCCNNVLLLSGPPPEFIELPDRGMTWVTSSNSSSIWKGWVCLQCNTFVSETELIDVMSAVGAFDNAAAPRCRQHVQCMTYDIKTNVTELQCASFDGVNALQIISCDNEISDNEDGEMIAVNEEVVYVDSQ
jgi:hypothetical protein